MKRSGRHKFELYFAGRMDQADEDEIFFQSVSGLSPGQRFIETWRLTETMMKLKGRDLDELRLDRTTLILKRS